MTHPVLPLSEILLFICSGAVASAESTDIEWGGAVPTLKNLTEIWGGITVHMTDWSRCNMGTLCGRIKKAVHLMDNRPIVVPEPEDKDPRLYEIKTDYDDKPHADHLKKLTKAVDEANSNASSTKALRMYNEYIEQDGLPYDYPEWLEYVHPGPGSLSHPTNNSSSYHGKWEYSFPDRFWKEGIATGTQFQRGSSRSSRQRARRTSRAATRPRPSTP